MVAKVNVKRNNLVTVPLIAMRGMVVFPNTVNHFDIARPRSITAVETAVKSGGTVFLVAQRDISVDEPEKDDLYKYGVVAEIQQVLRLSDSFIKVLVECKYRAGLVDIIEDKGCQYAGVMRAPVHRLKEKDEHEAAALVRAIREQLGEYIKHFPKLAGDIAAQVFSNESPAKFVEFITNSINLEYPDKQAILELSDVIERLKLLHSTLIRENRILAIEENINDKVQESMDQNQREYYLREQLKIISDELGDGSGDTANDAEEYRSKIEALPLEEENKRRLRKEVDRLLQTPPSSQESAVIRGYLDTVLDLPWGKYTEDNLDIAAARRVLDRDHYGLEKVKERIIENLAVRKLAGKQGSQIICLCGPPGVGKTSIARSVADSMNRKFVRMSLGGIKDESEIRGHRRTYVGSMPGRIISAIDQAGVSNPLLLLDEIDKLSNDYRGDPSSALLEVLDPEQNATFRDLFLDVPYDLSQVMFITTANDRSMIPAPLQDRMDIIELSSYTREEKFKIAKLHLIKKQLEKNGLLRSQFGITDRALYAVIDDYTREAGVRELERKLATLMRKAAKKIVSGESDGVKITPTALQEYLGPPISRSSIATPGGEIGIVNGLAWTSVGGEVMPIEVVSVKGNGKLEITGSLGDVMKESAKLAITYARTLPAEYNIPSDILTGWDIHIHAPEGAVPKDGPSAGVALATAIVSSLSKTPLKKGFAMTGEITLHGRVLPIGGLREKLMAAFKEKQTTVLIPYDNLCDLDDVSDEVKSALKILPVSDVKQALDLVLDRTSEHYTKKSVSAPSHKKAQDSGKSITI